MSITQDSDRVRWPGSGSAVAGRTPFGTFDSDSQFISDCSSSAVWAAIRLGYPIVDVELIDTSFYACFEESVAQYQAVVNEFNIRNNITTLQGQKVANVGNVATRNVQGFPLPYVVQLSRAYGTEVGTGGMIDWKKGNVAVVSGTQDYDLQALWGNVSESFNRIEIRRIFHHRPPASARIYDPFSMTGLSYSNVLNELGFGAYSPAVQFLMSPIFEDTLRMQAIKFNDDIRKSQYSFELVNNKLRIFPLPNSNFNLYFEYTVANDAYSGSLSPSATGSQTIISDFANIPYNYRPYSDINDTGKLWIRKYFLSLCKELLGAIRQKYQTIPIPGSEITLDGGELRSEAQTEKEALMTQLRESLDEAGRKKQMEALAQETEQLQQMLKSAPLFLYVG
jgi:hypothetical protein